jgi:hypothetical protein
MRRQPLATVALCLQKTHLKLTRIQAAIERLGRTSFRQEMEAAAPHDLRASSDRLL